MTVRAVKALRDAGCSLQRVRQVEAILDKEWGTDLAESVLFWDGGDVLRIDEHGRVMSVLAETGQLITTEVLHVMTFPLRTWISESAEVAVELDLKEIRVQREARRALANPTPTITFKDAFG